MKEQDFNLSEGDTAGYGRINSRFQPRQVASAVELFADVQSGRAPYYYLMEAFSPRSVGMAQTISSNYPGIVRINEAGQTTSDFPLLTGDVLDRMMLARYREFPAGWRNYCNISTLRDFRTVRRIAADGLEGQWDDIPEASEIIDGAMSETGYTYAPKKYGKATHISFEAMTDDDLNAFLTMPDRLGRGGARTVSKFATGLYTDASGPDATFYSVGNANIVTGNPVLGIAGLQTAWGILRSQTDSDGEPIMVEAAWLVVPPQLEVEAQNIMQSTQVWHNAAGGDTTQRLIANNWIGGTLRGVIVDPYIPVVASTANGNTSWFLFADPGVGRPALEMGFLAGFQEPQLYQKMSNSMRVTGGNDQSAGDFHTMSQAYKGVIVFGGTTLDPKSTVGSNGSAS